MKDLIIALVWAWETFGPMIIITAAISVFISIFGLLAKWSIKTDDDDWHHAVEENDWDDPETMAYIQRTQPRSPKARAITRIKNNRRKL